MQSQGSNPYCASTSKPDSTPSSPSYNHLTQITSLPLITIRPNSLPSISPLPSSSFSISLPLPHQISPPSPLLSIYVISLFIFASIYQPFHLLSLNPNHLTLTSLIFQKPNLQLLSALLLRSLIYALPTPKHKFISHNPNSKICLDFGLKIYIIIFLLS